MARRPCGERADRGDFYAVGVASTVFWIDEARLGI